MLEMLFHQDLSSYMSNLIWGKSQFYNLRLLINMLAMYEIVLTGKIDGMA